MSVPLVRIGDALGLSRTVTDIGPATAEGLAAATGGDRRRLREGLGPRAM